MYDKTLTPTEIVRLMMAVLRARAAAGEVLFHPLDGRV